MVTKSQLNANRENSKHSTGPRTESGKSNSSRNAQTLGLFTREDHVKPEERDFYQEFCETACHELNPEGFLEESSVSQIIGANWRLHLCDSAEAELSDFSETDDKTRRSIERARDRAVSVLNRSITQLRKLQTERILREQVPLGKVVHVPVADTRILLNARCTLERGKQLAAKNGAQETAQRVNELLNAPVPPVRSEATPTKKDTSSQMGSICEIDGASAAQELLATFRALQENPNLPCTCRSGRTYAECCGNDDLEELEIAA